MSNKQRVRKLEEKHKPNKRLIVAMEENDDPMTYIIHGPDGEKRVSRAEFEASISKGDHVVIVSRE